MKLLHFPEELNEPINEGWTRDEIIGLILTPICWLFGHNWISMGECGEICGRCNLERG